MDKPLVSLRHGTLLSRIITSLGAIGISNLIFTYWPNDWWPREVAASFMTLQFTLFPYFAQGVAGLISVAADQLAHVALYAKEYGQHAISQKKIHFYGARFCLMPIGLGSFSFLYETLAWSFLASSCMAAAIGWIVGFPFMDALMKQQLRSLPKTAIQKARHHIDKARSP